MAMLSMGSLRAQEVGGNSSTTTTTTTKEEVKVERMMKPADERAEDITNNMASQLHLTSKQTQQIRTINLDAARKMDAIRSQNKKDPDKIVEEGRKVDMEVDQKLSDILTPAQWSQYMRGKGRGQ
jgi:Spy/CpxP family protein refolding chaperone